jgi:hypothetical protein
VIAADTPLAVEQCRRENPRAVYLHLLLGAWPGKFWASWRLFGGTASRIAHKPGKCNKIIGYGDRAAG